MQNVLINIKALTGILSYENQVKNTQNLSCKKWEDFLCVSGNIESAGKKFRGNHKTNVQGLC